jgi:hypothetical protein
MAEQSEGKKREAKLRDKLSEIYFLDAMLRFALLASLCSAIFCRAKKGPFCVQE